MLKTKSSKLILTLLLVSVVALGAALSVSLLNLDNPNNVPDSNVAQAAISAASSFDKAQNGSKYYYTQPTSTTQASVTVNSSAAWGSAANPYVINTAAQWVLFANVFTNQTAGYVGSDKVYILGNDINFGGNIIPEVGRNSAGFNATLYGNKHQLSNGTVQWSMWWENNGHYSCGLFHYINGGRVYDINIASNIKLSMKTDINAVVIIHMGGLASVASNSLIVGVNSYVAISVSQTGKTAAPHCMIGGLIGHAWQGKNELYKVSHTGNMYFKANGGTAFMGTDDCHHMAHMIGTVSAPLTLNTFSSYGDVEAVYSGDDISMIIGKLNNASSMKITVTNGYLCGTVRATKPDPHPAYGIIIGWDHNCNAYYSESSISNIYANCTTIWTKNDGSTFQNCNLMWTYDVSKLTNVYVVGTDATVRAGGGTSASCGDTGGIKKTGSGASVINSANGNSNITNNFGVASNGSVTIKGNNCIIDYDLGGGSWTGLSGAAKSYTIGASKTISQLGTKPTKKGFTFSKWSFDAAGSSTVSASTNFNSVSGNRTIYAIWTVDGIGSPTSSAVTYGASSVSMSAPSHAAVTNNLATITYQWRKGSATGTVLSTSATYTISNPTVATSGTYYLTTVITPKDGRTPAKTETKSVTVTVNRKGVAIPTAATGLIYDGTAKNGVVSANTALYTVTGGTQTNANAYNANYTAIATLKDKTNYTWGADGANVTADQSITWRIEKKQITLPTLSNTDYTYTGSAQSPSVTYDNNNSTYAPAGNAQTNAGTYNASITLKDTTNYKWSGRSGANESDTFLLSWTIKKATPTLTAPNYIAKPDYDKGTNMYVGQKLGQFFDFDQTSGSHTISGASGATVSVAGTFSWTNANHVLVKTDTSLSVTFTPDDTANINSATINITVAPIQLYINAYEVLLEFRKADGSVVAYNASTSLKDLRSITSVVKVLAEVRKVPVSYGVSVPAHGLGDYVEETAGYAKWQDPTGYTRTYYRTKNAANDLSGAYGRDDILGGGPVTADVTVYVGYVAKEVTYTVYHVKEALWTDNINDTTPNNDRFLNDLAGALRDGIVETETFTAFAGSKVSSKFKTYEGFTRQPAVGSAGDCISDDQQKFVLGTGQTILISYYKRNTYNINWNFTGGKVTTESGTVLSGKTISQFKYGQTVEKISDPWYGSNAEDPHPQYWFVAWYTNSACTDIATIPATMPARALTFYAGREAQRYSISYSDGLDDLVNSDNEPITLTGKYVLNPANVDDCGPAYFTVDQIINNGVIRFTNPTLPGFRFMGWYEEGTDTKITSITRAMATKDYKLVARWKANTYNITLNTNGGDRLPSAQATIRALANFDHYPETVQGEYTPGSSGSLIVPTRTGYVFSHWAYRNESGEFIGVTTEPFDYLVNGTILYAQWIATDVEIDWHEDSDELLKSFEGGSGWTITVKHQQSCIDNGLASGLEESFTGTWSGIYLHMGDTITLSFTAPDGYQIESITLGDANAQSSFINNGRYNVRSYIDNLLLVNVQLKPITYSITYNWYGGDFTGSGSGDEVLARSYTFADESIKIMGGELAYRLGYTFQGWSLTDTNGVYEDGMSTVGDAGQNVSEITPQDLVGDSPRDVVLYAVWEAAPVTMIYHNNYGTSEKPDGEVVTQANIAKTGDTIVLYQPDSAPFIPVNRELIGWALTPNGDIAYNVSYTYNPPTGPADEGSFTPNDTYYMVRPNEDNVNNLYAVWRITNVQYLVFDSTGNGDTFSVGYDGVTMTARPRYAYVQEPGLTLNFYWYKVDPSWEKWTEADLEGLTGDAYNQVQTYIGLYKIPAGTEPIRTKSDSNLTPADQHDSFNVKNVNDAGTYICRLTATGKRISASGDVQSSTVTMYGQYEVSIRKADLPAITLASKVGDQAVTYNTDKQKLTVGVPTEWTQDANGLYILPDGSKLRVTYKYIDVKGNEYEEFVINAGSYTVEATFSFVDGKGNYNLPDKKIAQLTVNKQDITDASLSYELQEEIDGEWKKVGDGTHFADNVYTGNRFRIVAKSTNIYQSDANNVGIVIYYDGDVNGDHTNAPKNVGAYVAYCDSLTGDRADNYSLYNDLRSREFSIIKANHTANVTFSDVTAEYDGEQHEIRLTGVRDGDGNAVEITRGTDSDTFEIDGCVITVRYSCAYSPVVNNYNYAPADVTNRGGIHAGEYSVTATFEDAEENQINFNQIDNMYATLVVNQAKYSGYSKDDPNYREGLTDEQLNRYVDGKPNPNGFGENCVREQDPGEFYNPQLKLDAHFKVTYSYLWQHVGGTLLPFDKHIDGTCGVSECANMELDETTGLPKIGTKVGLNLAGLYQITARIDYVDQQYANDYAVVPDQVVQLNITPGEIEEIRLSYTQGSDEFYYYGDKFEFLNVNASGEYLVKVQVKYKNTENLETVNNRNVQFLIKDADGNLVPLMTGDILNKAGSFEIYARVYGVESAHPFTVNVQKATLDYGAVDYDKTGDRWEQTGSNWIYGYEYDGQYDYPKMAGSAANEYGFVGVETIEETYDLKVKYEYKLVSASDWTEIDGTTVTGIREAGEYNFRVSFIVGNKNYNDVTLDGGTKYWTTTVKVSKKVLTADDIIWQYTTTPEAENSWQTLQDLEYSGQEYTVRAMYRDLAAATETLIAVSEIALDGTPGATVKVTNANPDGYKVSISAFETANYTTEGTNFDAALKIAKKKVMLYWDNVELTYDGKDQLADEQNITANYSDVNGTEQSGVTIYAVNASGEKIAFANAGKYTLKADINDGNYEPTNPTREYEIAALAVTDETTVAWFYKDANGDLQTLDKSSMSYKGAAYEIFVQFNAIADDKNEDSGVTDGKRTVAALTADGISPIDVSNNTLSPAVQGNYDLTAITKEFSIIPYEYEIDWSNPANTQFVYNGQEQGLTVSLKGIGRESATDIIDLQGDKGTDASDRYSASAVVNAAYARNYKLVVKETLGGKVTLTNGTVYYDWAIAPRAVQLTWEFDGDTYNTYEIGYRANVTNICSKNGEEGAVADRLELTYELKFNGEAATEFKNAGSYEFTVTKLTDPVTGQESTNYTLTGATNLTATHTINKATPVLGNVAYTEYGATIGNDKAYEGGQLRASKLTYDCEVEGSIAFDKYGDGDANKLVAGSARYAWTFTPTDRDNYNEAKGDVRLTVVEDKAVGLVFDKNGLITFYTIGSTFDKMGIKVYIAFASCYEEDGVRYGRSDFIEDYLATVSFRYNGKLASTYKFQEEDEGEQVITALYAYQGRQLEGTINITVSSAVPETIDIVDRATYETAEYYVGQTFDYSNMKFAVTYAGYPDATIDSKRITVSDVMLNETGSKTITFSIATGQDPSISTRLTIEVLPKVTVEVEFLSRAYKWQDGNPIELVITQKDGSKIPEGITYFFGDKNGNKLTITDQGSYEVYVYFTVVNKVKYNDIAPVKAQIEVKDILAAVDRNKTDMPALDVTYNNTEFNYKLNNIVVSDGNGGVYNVLTDTVTYTINGYPEGNIVVKNAGTYEILVSFKVTNDELGTIQIDERYTITVAPDKNEIYNFAIESWIEGQPQSEVVINAKYGQATITYYTDADCTILYHDGKTRPNSVGVYYAVAVIEGCESYEQERATCRFSVNKATLESESKDEEGKSEIVITTDNGMDPSYVLVIEKLTAESTAEITIKKKIVLAGYSIDLVDGDGNRPATEQTYTVRLKLTAEQLSQKKLAVYSVNSLGQSVDMNGKVTEDGYIEFTVNTFEDATSEDHAALRFVIGARDAAAARRTGLIIGVSVGAVIAIIAIMALIIIFVKKKKENDE